MSRYAGSYDTRLIWLKHAPIIDSDTNQAKDTYVDNGFLWASVIDRSAAKIETIGSLTAQSTTEIRIRNFPALGFKDQLREKGSDTYYVIDGVQRGSDEWIVSATRKQVR